MTSIYSSQRTGPKATHILVHGCIPKICETDPKLDFLVINVLCVNEKDQHTQYSMQLTLTVLCNEVMQNVNQHTTILRMIQERRRILADELVDWVSDRADVRPQI